MTLINDESTINMGLRTFLGCRVTDIHKTSETCGRRSSSGISSAGKTSSSTFRRCTAEAVVIAMLNNPVRTTRNKAAREPNTAHLSS